MYGLPVLHMMRLTANDSHPSLGSNLFWMALVTLVLAPRPLIEGHRQVFPSFCSQLMGTTSTSAESRNSTTVNMTEHKYLSDDRTNCIVKQMISFCKDRKVQYSVQWLYSAVEEKKRHAHTYSTVRVHSIVNICSIVVSLEITFAQLKYWTVCTVHTEADYRWPFDLQCSWLIAHYWQSSQDYQWPPTVKWTNNSQRPIPIHLVRRSLALCLSWSAIKLVPCSLLMIAVWTHLVFQQNEQIV